MEGPSVAVKTAVDEIRKHRERVARRVCPRPDIAVILEPLLREWDLQDLRCT